MHSISRNFCFSKPKLKFKFFPRLQKLLTVLITAASPGSSFKAKSLAFPSDLWCKEDLQTAIY